MYANITHCFLYAIRYCYKAFNDKYRYHLSFFYIINNRTNYCIHLVRSWHITLIVLGCCAAVILIPALISLIRSKYKKWKWANAVCQRTI